MLPQTISVRYIDFTGNKKTRSLNGLRKDLTDTQIKTFVENSVDLMGFSEVVEAIVTTKRYLV